MSRRTEAPAESGQTVCCVVYNPYTQACFTAPDGSPLSLCQGGPLLASHGRLRSALQSLLK